MPDANGRFKGIRVPAAGWERVFDPEAYEARLLEEPMGPITGEEFSSRLNRIVRENEPALRALAEGPDSVRRLLAEGPQPSDLILPPDPCTCDGSGCRCGG